MTSNKNIVVVQAQAFASQLIPAVVGVLSFMLLARNTKPDVRGEFLVYLAAVVLFEMIKSGGLQSALVMRISGNGKEQQVDIFGRAYWLGTIISFSISLILAVLFFSK